jgi:hypothetical protein
MTGQRLPLPDARTGNYVEALDPGLYVTATPVNSPRHRVRDNLPASCPVLRKTPALMALTERNPVRGATLAGKAAEELQTSAGMPSRTLHALEYGWRKGRIR